MKDIEGIERALEILAPHWSEIEADFEKYNNQFLHLASVDHDSIGRILKAHLIVETFIEKFLIKFYGLGDLKPIRLSFSQKASLLPVTGSSASYVRPGILQLNSIRNKFGHQIGHTIEGHEISAIYEVLQTARPTATLQSHVAAIEAFTPIACAFLSVPPMHLQDAFMKAFAEIRSFEPSNLALENNV